MHRVRERGWVCWVLIWCCAVCAGLLATEWRTDFNAFERYTNDDYSLTARDGVIEFSINKRHLPPLGGIPILGRFFRIAVSPANKWWVETRCDESEDIAASIPVWMAALPFVVAGVMSRARLVRESGIRWRMRRLAWLAGVFAMVCVVVAFFPRYTERFGVTIGGRRIAVVSCTDMVALSVSGKNHEQFEMSVPFVFERDWGPGLDSQPGYSTRAWGGVGFVSGPQASGAVAVELGTLLVLVGVPTAVLAWRTRYVRVKPNACAKCGYDLAGVTAGVCPECGEKSEVLV